MRLLAEVHGASDEGKGQFASGVAGLTTPNAGCTNCVLLVARAYACGAQPTRPIARPVQPAAEPAAIPIEPAAIPAEPVLAPTPAEPPVIIIIQPQR